MASEQGGRRPYGGVGPVACTEGVGTAAGGVAPAAGAAGAGQHPDFVYNGGPVIRNPQVYTSFWGASWSDAAHAARSAQLNQFVQDLLASEYMNILSQYGVGSGAGSAGSFIKQTFAPGVSGEIDENDIANIVQNLIDTGDLPEPPASDNNTCLLIYLDESVAVKQPGLRMCEPSDDNAFGFHSDFVTSAGNEFYYAVMPALDDTCITNTCGTGGGCSLKLSQTQEQRLTQVTSHEFAEMVTDPKFQTGWFGPTSDENGDICNGQPATITVGGRVWNVQRQYSKTDDQNSSGATFCVVGAATPMPERGDGPA
jgi:hypothetical protein